MKYFFLIFFFVTVIVISMAGLRGGKFADRPIMVFPDMDDQPRLNYQETSEFFADGVGARKPVVGTLPVGFEIPDKAFVDGGQEGRFGFTIGGDYYHTGRFGDYWGSGMPEQVEVTEAFLERGQDRYAIYCAVCHGTSGNGKGITSNYGVPNIANFHLEQFADPGHPDYRTDGDVYNTIAYGKGLMGPYAEKLTVHDRWAVVAYLRALQASWKVEKSAVSDEFDAATGSTEAPPADPAAPAESTGPAAAEEAPAPTA